MINTDPETRKALGMPASELRSEDADQLAALTRAMLRADGYSDTAITNAETDPRSYEDVCRDRQRAERHAKVAMESKGLTVVDVLKRSTAGCDLLITDGCIGLTWNSGPQKWAIIKNATEDPIWMTDESAACAEFLRLTEGE